MLNFEPGQRLVTASQRVDRFDDTLIGYSANLKLEGEAQEIHRRYGSSPSLSE
jgi:hypothetical protein